MAAVWWEPLARDGAARTGRLHTPHGVVPTPAFMPVGSRGAVRFVDSEDLRQVGATILLANTYHLMLRPGPELVAALGELHGFMGWQGSILTDSGGFQVFSLAPDVDEDGVTFRSTYDGSAARLTPESAMAAQERLGADVAIALDVLVGLPAPRAEVEAAMERTLRWAARAVAARTRADRGVFGIVQGGADRDLRARSAATTAALGFDGYGIGGLSVGESAAQRDVAISAVIPELPVEAPRYVMGIGDTDGILAAVARGVDLFDCVLPTRLGRHGRVLHRDGDFSVRRARHADSREPLDERCSCGVCCRYSRGYIRHLFATKEALGPRLVTIHNLAYTFALMGAIREAINAGGFAELSVRRTRRG